jgi:hypothetical protein
MEFSVVHSPGHLKAVVDMQNFMQHFNDAATVGLENGPTGTIDYLRLLWGWGEFRNHADGCLEEHILGHPIRESVEMSNGGEVWR